MGLVALATMSGKYSRRQANIERQYEARERVAVQINAENNPEAAARIQSSDAQRPYKAPGEQLVPIWPLAVLLGLVSAVAAVMLFRSRKQTLQTES